MIDDPSSSHSKYPHYLSLKDTTLGCCFTSSADDSGKALFLCWLCIRHGYFNINPT
ncbi:unnamed protein product, partial [Brassica oleracea]